MKIHCSLLDPSKTSQPSSFPLYKVKDQQDVPPPPSQLVCSLSESLLLSEPGDTSLTSCQLSPQSESSSLNFTIFPVTTSPASDLDTLPSSSSSYSPSYYTLSPPDLLSPPLSTTSISEACLSPASQSSPPHSNITYNICSQSTNEESLLQSFGTKDNEAPMSIMSRTEAVMQQTGQEQSSVSPPPAHHNLINIDMNNQPEDGTITILSSTAGLTSRPQQMPDCCNCSQQSSFCSKQSKLKQLYEQSHQDHQDHQEPSQHTGESVCGLLPADENFMKLMENSSDKNIKQSMSGEGKEKMSTATLEISDSSDSSPTCQQRTQSCPLPPDIPTLSSLSKTSPKLSTWRQTRIISEKLEQHLWTWRCACKKSGKRISKSLLQARAKWAFRKAGIVEFKVIIYIELGLTPVI